MIFIALLVGLRLIALDEVSGRWAIAAAMVDALIGAAVVSLGISIFSRVFVPPVPGPSFTQIEPWRIAETINDAHVRTDTWTYVGHTGRHLRSATLPAIEKLCKTDKRHRLIEMVVLDPTKEDSCQHFSGYRNSLQARQSTESKWDLKSVQREVIATLLAATECHANNHLITIRIGVTTRISPLRFDISSSMALLTNESPRIPALYFASDSSYYGIFGEETRVVLEASQSLQMPTHSKLVADMSVADIVQTLESLGVPMPSLSERDCRWIRHHVRARLNPF